MGLKFIVARRFSLIKKIEKELLTKGNAQEKVLKIYGKQVHPHTASLYLTGIRMHLNKIKEIDKNLNPLETENDDYKEVSYNSDKTQTIKQDIYLSEDEAASPTKIMQKMGFDPLLWEVISCKVINGSFDVTMKMINSTLAESGEVIKTSTPLTVTNRKYSITLTVKPLSNNLTFPQIIQAFEVLTPVKLNEYTYKSIPSTVGLLLELPIMDFHLGKLAWSGETGNDYDLKVAEKLWYKTIVSLIWKALKYDTIEKIIFPVGQDYFHFDTPKTTTTAGTPLDSDTRWEKMYDKGIELLVWTVEQLRKIAPVEIMWVPGNHDRVLSYTATVGLAQRYSKTDSVTVNLSATPRKYILFGKNLIGYSHGENEGKRIDGLMQVEAPEYWAKSIFREFHMGHLHSELSRTTNGIIFRRISSITALDSWHVDGGFIGATRQAQAFIWNKETGLEAILNSNVFSKK